MVLCNPHEFDLDRKQASRETLYESDIVLNVTGDHQFDLSAEGGVLRAFQIVPRAQHDGQSDIEKSFYRGVLTEFVTFGDVHYRCVLWVRKADRCVPASGHL